MISKTYSNANLQAFSGGINNLGSTATTVKCALLDNTYTPNQDSHADWSTISSAEISASGYSAGGAEVTTKSLSLTGNVVTFDGDNVQWTSTATITARYAVVYDTGSSYLLCYHDFESDESATNGTFTVQWNSSGIFQVSAST